VFIAVLVEVVVPQQQTRIDFSRLFHDFFHFPWLPWSLSNFRFVAIDQLINSILKVWQATMRFYIRCNFGGALWCFLVVKQTDCNECFLAVFLAPIFFIHIFFTAGWRLSCNFQGQRLPCYKIAAGQVGGLVVYVGVSHVKIAWTAFAVGPWKDFAQKETKIGC